MLITAIEGFVVAFVLVGVYVGALFLIEAIINVITEIWRKRGSP